MEDLYDHRLESVADSRIVSIAGSTVYNSLLSKLDGTVPDLRRFQIIHEYIKDNLVRANYVLCIAGVL